MLEWRDGRHAYDIRAFGYGCVITNTKKMPRSDQPLQLLQAAQAIHHYQQRNITIGDEVPEVLIR